MRYGKRLLAPIGAALVLGIVALGGAPGLVAQEDMQATPEAGAARPAHIHNGTCEELGDVVQPLTDLTAATGTAEGNADAIPAEYSYTLVPMSLDDILAEDHAINVHESAENIGNYIACGNLGGVRDANGALVIGLSELNDSGYTGIAYLAPDANDPSATGVSVFIAPVNSDTPDAGV
ncbi:MAG TPA: hypothetical protein VIL01_06010 [Thermomicrobiales bacterium]